MYYYSLPPNKALNLSSGIVNDFECTKISQRVGIERDYQEVKTNSRVLFIISLFLLENFRYSIIPVKKWPNIGLPGYGISLFLWDESQFVCGMN